MEAKGPLFSPVTAYVAMEVREDWIATGVLAI